MGGLPTDNRLSCGDLTLDPAAHSCDLGGNALTLTATEFSLLSLLVKSPQQVFDRNQLIAGIYGPNSTLSGRTLDSHLRNVRAKAAALGSNNVITTIHSIGLKLGTCRK